MIPVVPARAVTVQLFASHAAAAGARQIEVTVPEPVTVAALRGAALEVLRVPGGARGEGRAAAERQVLVAVNSAYAADEAVIAPGDEVALIPPVAGG